MTHEFALTVECDEEGLYTVHVSDGAGPIGQATGYTRAGVMFKALNLLAPLLDEDSIPPVMRGGHP